MARCSEWFARLQRISVDGGDTGEELAQWVKNVHPGVEVEVVKRSDDVKGFKVLPRRWVVDRRFGWLMVSVTPSTSG